MQKPPNAFQLFIFDQQRGDGMQDLRGKKMAELTALCGPAWEGLKEKEKDIYREKAAKLKGAEWGRKDSRGRPIIKVLLNEPLPLPVRVRRDLESRSAALSDEVFYVADVQIWCDRPHESVTMPAEIGMVKLSVKRGVIAYENWLVPAGSVPLTSRNDMVVSSERGHKLPTENDFNLRYKDPTTRHRIVAEGILSFLGCERTKERKLSAELVMTPGNAVAPSIYVMARKLEHAERSFAWILEKACIGKEDARRISFYPLNELLFQLTSSKGEAGRPFCPSETMAEALLEANISYRYAVDLRCEEHAPMDVDNMVCAVASARLHAFLFLKAVCPCYGVEMLPGKHYHLQDNLGDGLEVDEEKVRNFWGLAEGTPKGGGGVALDNTVDLVTGTSVSLLEDYGESEECGSETTFESVSERLQGISVSSASAKPASAVTSAKARRLQLLERMKSGSKNQQ